MIDTPDADLLEQFARENSEAAFTTLVERHIGLVHSVAVRHTANPQSVQDITQAVFIILARKAGTLNRKTILPGWLYQAARLTAANFQRAEIHRIQREQEAYMQSTLQESAPDTLWSEMSPLLDEAMSYLGASDRDALVLRYFQNKSLSEVGLAMGLEERTAQKRVTRAIEKLRKFFTKRGVSATTATLGGAISANSVQAAPVALAKSVTAVALAKGATASISTLTLIKGALKIMAWTKAKTAIVVSAAVILVAGTTTTLIIQHQHHVKVRTDFPKSSWALAGYADPASALETILWAGNHADGKTLLASMTPDLQQQLQQRFGDDLQKQGISLEEFFTRSAKNHVSTVTGFRVLSQQIVTDDKIILHLYVQGKEREDTFKMKKIGNEWKLDQFPPDY
jgi:RNA polymerase sigma factor (sigma-70 family)